MTVLESVEIKMLTSTIKGTNKKLSWFITLAVGILITLFGWIYFNSKSEAEFRGTVVTEINSMKAMLKDVKESSSRDRESIKKAVNLNSLKIQEINNHLIKQGGYDPIVRSME